MARHFPKEAVVDGKVKTSAVRGKRALHAYCRPDGIRVGSAGDAVSEFTLDPDDTGFCGNCRRGMTAAGL